MAKAVMGIDFLGLEDGNAPTASPPGMSSTMSMTGAPTSMTNFNALQQETKGVAPAAPPAASTAEGFTARRRENDFLFLSPLPSPQRGPRFLAQTPVRSRASESVAETSHASGPAAPLTIFYNGTVATFHLPPDKAEAIISWAERTTPPGVRRMERPVVAFVPPPRPQQQPFSLDKLERDLPLARKRSLQRFLEKRKER